MSSACGAIRPVARLIEARSSSQDQPGHDFRLDGARQAEQGLLGSVMAHGATVAGMGLAPGSALTLVLSEPRGHDVLC